ncbi:tripartite tricarboxylate transporter substrate binding protein [Polynucleobacter sp. AP-Melu-500A-A1]|uniref:tripartite tricarboxylate transporter substrate binding protein n=1 Tax=Polynucleobacter sp. AP-Melu-500A-A1 TaxID=2576929 RepID=UPI001C0C7112|nr:tripartite tricarboxylate transporter substrate binding protein [Polynucleobacter sp. AP-Melu-500A-A1]MBU3631235.1 tripartite tricarboxylate transporter substrate binding protein [Polynucleobacter sp. AP-Melu-500A-A1]
MKSTSNLFFQLVILALVTITVSEPALSQNDKPLTLVVPFPPGGSTDITARTIQTKLAERIGRPVVIENRPGAASQIATQHVARSAPDGNTLLISFDNHSINPIVKPKLPYDTFKDFVGVSLLVRFPLVIAANPSVPGNNLAEFIAAAKKRPGFYSYASTGIGSLNQLAMEDIKRKAGIFVLHVPYGGGGPAIAAVVGNTASMTLLSYAALKGQIQADKLKPLAVTGAQRLPELPKTPTVAESGYPGFEAYSWIGAFAPAETPAAIVKKLTADFQAVLNDPEIKTKLSQGGFDVQASDGPTLDKYAKREFERWQQFVKTTQLNLED